MAAAQPSREGFAAYWKDYGVFSWRQLVPYIVYLGGLALYGVIIQWIDAEARFWLPSIIVAGVYIVLFPYAWIKRVQKRYAQFLRCPDCGDWFGEDASGAYSGPNPKFKTIIQTGRCFKCGRQILANTSYSEPSVNA